VDDAGLAGNQSTGTGVNDLRRAKVERVTMPLTWFDRIVPSRFRTRRATEPLHPVNGPQNGSDRLLYLARIVYRRLPLSQAMKWRVRARLAPLLFAIDSGRGEGGWGRVALAAIGHLRTTAGAPQRDEEREIALADMLEAMANHARTYGPMRHWIALPFLSTGGAEMVALNLCRALWELRPDQSILLLITDRPFISEHMVIPAGVLMLRLDDYLTDDTSYARKQALLRDLLIAARPHCFHNINSEVAWHLILEEGERLQRYTRLFASIFAFQFKPDRITKLGYAASFLKKGMPYLSGLLSDNARFVVDAAEEYALTPQERSRMHVLYQPCRLLGGPDEEVGRLRLVRRKADLTKRGRSQHGRPEVLWAGRLDSEKRIDLFLDVVRRCDFADFHVFGQVVLANGLALPDLPNLTYEGPFTSPLEWLDRFDFDAFIFTSLWEGMPNILIEVGTLGIPVIAPTVGGVGELITTDTGYPLVEQPTVEDYAEALKDIVDNPLDALRRSEQLLDLVSERHSWEHFVAAVAAVPDYADKAASVDESGNASARAPGKESIPLVSIIIPCYNQGHFLQDSIQSALASCQHPLEIIVVDDGSTGEANALQLAAAERLAPGIVRIHRQKNLGLSGARNTGISLARGRYIQFLDADDVLAPMKITTQVAQLEVNPQIDVSVCNYLLCDEDRLRFCKPGEAIARFDLTEEDFLYRWERGFCIPIHCGLFRRTLLEQVSFDVGTRAKEDWLFWVTLALTGARFGYVHGHWAIYRQHSVSMRQSHVNMGRAWLQTGLKIDAMLADRSPLFFDSVVCWFEQNYRSHPNYVAEIAEHRDSLNVPPEQSPAPLVTQREEGYAPHSHGIASAILDKLAVLTASSEPPLISVIIPVYGHFDYIERCLESVATQGDLPIEIVCVDDASPDPRVTSLMQALQDQNPRLTVRVERVNKGISATQNTAVDMATGTYLAFLDCDDELEPGALQIVATTLASNPDIDYLFTDRIDIDEMGKTLRVARYGGYENLHFSEQSRIASDLMDGMVASHLKVIRRELYQDLGGCDAAFSGVQDLELALRIGQDHKLFYLAQPLYRHRTHNRSVTQADKTTQLRKTNEVRRIYQERNYRTAAATRLEVQTFRGADLPVPLETLKTAWADGRVCVVDARGALDFEQTQFLREFNSYFDQIIWSDPQVPAALFGYLCGEVSFVRSGCTATQGVPCDDIDATSDGGSVATPPVVAHSHQTGRLTSIGAK
jgi:glycosyltransferase involved in cell wall biosynthesis